MSEAKTIEARLKQISAVLYDGMALVAVSILIAGGAIGKGSGSIFCYVLACLFVGAFRKGLRRERTRPFTEGADGQQSS